MLLQRMLGTLALVSAFGLGLVVAHSPDGGLAAQTDARYFPETQHWVKGLFLTYWTAHGGLAQQGYPLTEEFAEKSTLDGKTYTVQYFERAIFERHPENVGTPYEVLLAQLGKYQIDSRYPGGSQPAAAPVPGGQPPTPVAVPPRTVENTIAALKQAGLPIAETVVYTAETDPNKLLGRPNQYSGKASWHDSRLPAPKNPQQIEVSEGGGVELFLTGAAAQARYDYIVALGKGSPLFAEYDTLHGPLLLRLSKTLTPTQAQEYQNALDAIPLP